MIVPSQKEEREGPQSSIKVLIFRGGGRSEQATIEINEGRENEGFACREGLPAWNR